MYQLLSNSRSLYNQQIILENIGSLVKEKKLIKIEELSKLIQEITDLKIDASIIQRELELLILRNLLHCKIEGKSLVFD